MKSTRRNLALMLSLVSSSLACGGTGSPRTATYAISGNVRGAALSGVTIALAGASSATTTSDGSGNYSFAGLANGSYTVTPSKAGYAFSPVGLSSTINDADVTDQNFTARCQRDCSSKHYGDSDGCGGICTVDCGGWFCLPPLNCEPKCVSHCIADYDGCGRVCTLQSGADFCTCVPDCSDKCIGDSDGCGFVCTADQGARNCCIPDCAGKCVNVDDGCGAPCTVSEGTTCSCTPNCAGKCAGADDGCGLACSTNNGPLCCSPQCAGLPHGADDGCGGICPAG